VVSAGARAFDRGLGQTSRAFTGGSPCRVQIEPQLLDVRSGALMCITNRQPHKHNTIDVVKVKFC